MEENEKRADRNSAQKGGKGFYIVLFLCAAVIGVSSWSLISGTRTVDEPEIPELYVGSYVEDDFDIGEDIYIPNEEQEIPVDEIWIVPEDVEEIVVSVEPPVTVAEQPTVVTEPEPDTQTVVEVADTAPTAYIWPIIGNIDMPFAVTELVYNRTMGDWRTHEGVDIAAALGDTVMSVSAGVVTKVYDDELYGTTVVIEHGGGLSSVYSNLAEVPTVIVGDSVMMGDVIGAIGDTSLFESAQPIHLHFEMRLDGISVDPNDYLPLL